MTDTRDALKQDLLRWLDAPDPSAFDALAERVVRYQIAALPTYGRVVAARGGFDGDWRTAPMVPTALFRDLDLCSAPVDAADTVFNTSGTTSGARGTRRVPDLTLYDAAMSAPFVAHVLGGDPTPRPWISLIPSQDAQPNSSLSHMITALSHTLASSVAWLLEGRDFDRDAWRATVDGADGPVIVLTTSYALLHFMGGVDEASLALPPGSRIMTTGGFKRFASDVSEAELDDSIAQTFGVPSDNVVSEYGMTELSSQAYGRPLVANPALRLRVVDPATFAPVGPHTPGLVACFDLLNLDNVSAILTSDVGSLDDDGRLTLHGRAPDAVARGCSLTAEELLSTPP